MYEDENSGCLYRRRDVNKGLVKGERNYVEIGVSVRHARLWGTVKSNLPKFRKLLLCECDCDCDC